MKTFWVGLGHRQNTGKNLFGALLYNELVKLGIDSHCTSFASNLKMQAQQLFHQYGMMSGMYYEANRDEKEAPLGDLDASPRDIYIKLGLFMRSFDKDYWLNALMNDPFHQQYRVTIVTDVRFPNELERIQADGIGIRIDRPSVPHSEDPADNALGDRDDLWDGWITNDRDEEGLREYAREYAEGISKRLKWGK